MRQQWAVSQTHLQGVTPSEGVTGAGGSTTCTGATASLLPLQHTSRSGHRNPGTHCSTHSCAQLPVNPLRIQARQLPWLSLCLPTQVDSGPTSCAFLQCNADLLRMSRCR